MRVTASKVGLLSHCQWWARDEAEWSDSTSDASDLGVRFHKAIADYVSTGNSIVSDADIRGRMGHAIVWADGNNEPHTLMLAEQAYAWDLSRNVAEPISALNRDYSAYPSHLCGTADVVITNARTKRGAVADWKTGDGSKASAQLHALACMVARAEGLEEVAIESLEVSDDGVIARCSETLGPWDFAETRFEVRENIGKIPGSKPQPGAHCTELYCPALATCPASRGVIEQIIPAASLTRKWGLTVESPDHAAWLYEHAKLVAKAAEQVRDAVRSYVPESGVRLSDGRTLREGTRQVTRVDHKAIRELAEYHGATPAELDACTRVATESAGLRIGKAKP